MEKSSTGVLGGVVHGSHPGALFGCGSFLQAVVDQGGQGVPHVRLQHVGIQRVVESDLFGTLHGLEAVHRDLGGLVGDDGAELVIVDVHDVVFKSAASDSIGDPKNKNVMGKSVR